MSLNERLDYEKGKITARELFTKTCCQCKYWIYRVTRKLDYCHKCVNNPKVPIRSKHGYSIEALYDYYSPTPCPIVKYTQQVAKKRSNLTLLPTLSNKPVDLSKTKTTDDKTLVKHGSQT